MNRCGRVRALSWIGMLLLAFVTIGVRPASAEENETFGLVPHPESVDATVRRTFSVPLEPGAVFEDVVRVYNRTDQPIELILYPADAEAGLDGTISVGFRGARLKGVGSWIHLSRDTLRLPPRGEAKVQFRIEVRSADPSPDLGAIAVETTEKGVAANLAERLSLVVRTTAPNSPTTSVRVRPLLLRSPWIIVAILGLIVALTIVWLGARRARRPKDSLVPSGNLETTVEPEVTPAASRPVLRRLGETEERASSARRRQSASGTRTRGQRTPRPPREPKEASDARPMIDDMLKELGESEPEAPRPARRRATRPTRTSSTRTRRKQPQKKSTGPFIPLDDL